MPKPNQNSSVKEMKDYIRSKKLNHPLIRLGLKKAELVSGLKKLGHWDEVAKVKKTRVKKAKGSFNVKNTSPSQVKGSSKKPEKKKAEPKKKGKQNITFDDLYNSEFDKNYLNEWMDEPRMSYGRVKSATNKLLKAYLKKTDSPSIEGAMKYVKQNS
jgi:hypothetical protein